MIKSWKKFNERISITTGDHIDNLNLELLTDIFQDIMDDFPLDIEIYTNRRKCLVARMNRFDGSLFKNIKEYRIKMMDDGYVDQIGDRMEDFGYKLEQDNILFYQDAFYLVFEKIPKNLS